MADENTSTGELAKEKWNNLAPMPRVSRQSEVNLLRVNFSAEHQRSTDAVISKNRTTANHRLVMRLAGSAMYRAFRQAFEDATGLPLTLRPVESWQLAHTESRRQNGFCALISQRNRSCAACLQVQQRACEGVNNSPCTLSCAFGLKETAVGVKTGREMIAYLQTGQVFFEPPTPAQTRRVLEQIREWGLDLDRDEVARRYRETPVVGRNDYEARVRLLEFFAGQLGGLANQIILQQRDAEPAQITRARQVIETQYQEDLRLAGVARQVGMCACYLCKQFKKSTGVNFARYVSGVRVEKAKNLLWNLNYRVSEVAFQVGFQSLSNFNVVFKKITGESPTEYRRHLPKA